MRISADLDRLSRRLHDNADLQQGASGRPSHSSGHSPAPSSGPAPGHPSGAPSGHASFGHVVEPSDGGGDGGGGGRDGHHAASWAAPVGSSFVAAGGTPQVHTAMGWAQRIGLGQAFEPQHGEPGGWLHPVPSSLAGATAAHQLGLPIR